MNNLRRFGGRVIKARQNIGDMQSVYGDPTLQQTHTQPEQHPEGTAGFAALLIGNRVLLRTSSSRVCTKRSGDHTQSDSSDLELFVSVGIPGSYYPPGNESSYEELLPECLRKANLGDLSGGGSSIGGEPWHDIDFDVTDLDGALTLLRSELIRLKAPGRTVLTYTQNSEDWQETLSENGEWVKQRYDLRGIGNEQSE